MSLGVPEWSSCPVPLGTKLVTDAENRNQRTSENVLKCIDELYHAYQGQWFISVIKDTAMAFSS